MNAMQSVLWTCDCGIGQWGLIGYFSFGLIDDVFVEKPCEAMFQPCPTAVAPAKEHKYMRTPKEVPQADNHTDVPRAAIERFAEEGKADGVDRAVAFISEDCFCLLELTFE